MAVKKEMPPTIPLFPEPPRVPRVRRRSQPSVQVSWCPRCGGGQKRVGLLHTGTHLVWREHTYRTWSGVPMVCPASGVAVCALPPKNDPTVRCACEGP